MAGLAIATRNVMLDRLGFLVVEVSLHTADPDPGGAHEVFGGIPQYTRRAVQWVPATGATITNRAGVTFNVPGKTRVTHLGYWAAGGSYCGSRPLEQSESFNGPGTFTLAPGEIVEKVA